MTVRVLKAPDADAMAQIHAASFETGWPALDMAVHIGRDLCLGVEQHEGGTISAFVILRRSDVDAEILTIATQPSARGQGLARRLLRAAQDRLKSDGLRHIFLEVAEDNVAAQGLYESLGYAPIGRRPGYYVRQDGRVAALTYSQALQ
ncbi:MAG: GNAT family N-acetyltransferase [Pseudomonadota bacterium]